MKDFLGWGRESDYKDADVVILPIPYDETSTYVKGADKGPAAILEASNQLENYSIEAEEDICSNTKIHTSSIKTVKDIKKMHDTIYKKASELLSKNKFIVSLGGEHSISAGVVKAYKEKYPKLSVLQLDAHDDLRDEFEGSKYNHACVMKRIREICPAVQVGIRSVEKRTADQDIFYAKDMHDNDGWMDKAISKLSGDVYITFDLDFLDPSIMPSTGTPEPGGLLWYQTLKFLKKVAEKKNIVGFDVIELCPIKGMVAPDFLAAKLVYTLIGYSRRP